MVREISALANRHDFSLSVPSNNLLQDLRDQQKSVLAVGKIQDIFAGVSFTTAVHTTSNERRHGSNHEIISADERRTAFGQSGGF